MTHTLHTPRATRRPRHLPRGVDRRDLLRFGLAGMGLAALGPFGRMLPAARGAPAGQTFLVVINLFGGNDGTNMVIPTALSNYYARRPGIAIPPASQLSLRGGPGTSAYALHPSLPRLQALWDDGDLALVNLVGYPQANLSHFASQDIYSLGVRGDFTGLGIGKSGWIARFADLHAPTPMGAVSVGVGRPLDFVGGSSSPFLVSSLEGFRFQPDPRYPHNHLHRLQAIRDVLEGFAATGVTAEAAEALRQGHELTEEIQAAVESYTGTGDYRASNGSTYNIHRYLKDIARLVQHGFETRIFFTGFGGFDTHSSQQAANRHPALLDRLDTALDAFATDMKQFGMWDDTVVVVVSEFGRRNYQNGSGGTDHGGASPFVVAGGAVNGGVYGRDVTETDLNQEWLAYDVDFRDIYREILADHLGTDPSAVFPEAQPTSVTLGLV